jgi:hypothetical protein
VERRDGAHVVRAPGVALVVAGDAAPAVELGWVAPRYGVKERAPVVSIVADGAADATFTTVVLPLPPGATVPTLDVREDGDGTTVEIAGARFTDTLRWSDGGGPLDLGPLRCRAAAGWIRTGPDGALRVRAAGVGGGPVWTGWDASRGMSAGREGEL